MRRSVSSVAGVLVVSLAGCSETSSPSEAPAAPPAAATPPSDSHGHAHHPPHGGALVELGEHAAHLELLVDPANGTMTIYVLDGSAERSVGVAEPALLVMTTVEGRSAMVSLPAIGSGRTGKRAGDRAEFRGESDTLRGASRVDARVETLTVRGQTFDNVRVVWSAGVS